MIRIATSDARDITYAAAGAICSSVNRMSQAGTNLLCLAQPQDGGSLTNIKQVLNRETEFAIVQSDITYKTRTGAIVFPSKIRAAELRQVVSLYSVPFHLVARAELKARGFDDFRDHRFNSGPIGSGTQAALTEYVEAKGWNFSEFSLVQMFGRDQVGRSLCAGELDGFFLATGIGSEAVIDAVSGCDAKILPLNDAVAKKLIAERPYYSPITIPPGTYPGHADPIETFGVLTTLVTNSQMEDTVVANVAKAILADLDNLKRLNAALASLGAASMVDDDTLLPYHAGAAQLFRDMGLR